VLAYVSPERAQAADDRIGDGRFAAAQIARSSCPA
jgi:hypothetical protein